jgi:hypothetical protein
MTATQRELQLPELSELDINLYAELGLDQDASETQIWRQIGEWNKFSNRVATPERKEEVLKLVALATKYLLDPKRKEEYDTHLETNILKITTENKEASTETKKSLFPELENQANLLYGTVKEEKTPVKKFLDLNDYGFNITATFFTEENTQQRLERELTSIVIPMLVQYQEQKEEQNEIQEFARLDGAGRLPLVISPITRAPLAKQRYVSKENLLAVSAIWQEAKAPITSEGQQELRRAA